MNEFGRPELFVILLIVCVAFVATAVMIVPYWKIYSKTGQPGALALLQIVPLVNIVMLYVLAFTEWPIERQIREGKDVHIPS